MRKKKQCEEHLYITDLERGEEYCGTCGIVLTEKIEDRQHEDSFQSESGSKSISRTGPSLSLSMHDKGLYTIIGDDKDSSGHMLTGRTKSTFHRLRSWDKRSKSVSLTRNFGAAFTMLHGLKTKLGIPDNVMEYTAYLYRKAVSKQLVRGRSIAPILSATLYASCRANNTPRSLDDIAKAANVRKRTISRALRLIIRELGLSLQQYDMDDFLCRMINNLGLNEKIKRDGLDILEKSKKIGLSEGKNPVAFAAASLYVSCVINDKHLSQGTIAEASGISTVTIRNTTTQIKKKLKIRF